jgi:nucleoside-diphosphate-sugar epimerase
MNSGNNKIMVTGCNGFVGSNLCKTLKENNFNTIKVSRSSINNKEVNLDLKNYINWKSYLANIDIVIHTAGRVHFTWESTNEKLNLYKKINVEGTLNLAKQASISNVKRFIYISTIKVVGEKSQANKPFNEGDYLEAVDPYAQSKIEAEEELIKLSKETNMEIVIIRPPLIYGPGVGANFLNLLQWVHRGIPLPLKAVKNLRSFISLYNLIDFIILCIDHPDAKNEIFFISDDDDLSIVHLIKKISKAMNKSTKLIYVPIIILKFICMVFMKKDIIDKLTDSLQIDISKAKKILKWKPKIKCDEAIQLTVDYFLTLNKNRWKDLLIF